MSKSTTPRTDGNKHALDHLERYGFENSLDDPVVEWPILCEEIERELAEAKFDLQFRRELYALQTNELNEAKEQRDRLADALRELWNNHTLHGAAYELIEQTLEAVAGRRTPNNCQRPELCLLTETCIPCAICPHAVKGGTP
jgi:hypothetical protein